MKRNVDLVAVLLIAIAIALASLVAAVKLGHPVKAGGYGFSSGG